MIRVVKTWYVEGTDEAAGIEVLHFSDFTELIRWLDEERLLNKFVERIKRVPNKDIVLHTDDFVVSIFKLP